MGDSLSDDILDLENRLGDCPVETVSISVLKLGDSVRTDGEDEVHVRALAELETPLPPILVQAGTMKVVDGAHRVRAAALRGESEIRARLYAGSVEEAFVLAVLLNSRHGLPLTAADRAAAARRVVTAHPEWSNRRVARLAGLSPTTVANLRRCSTDRNGQLPARVGSDGRTRPVAGATGRLHARELLLSSPELSLRQIARAAGIAPSTVRDVRDRIAQGEDPLPPRQRRTPPAPGPAEGQAARRPPAPDRTVLLKQLRNDPSLRFNDSGRSLLRWLGQYSDESAALGRLVQQIPPHCATTVAELIRANAAAWAECAAALERRADPHLDADRARCAS